MEKDIELPVLPKEVYELLPTFFTDVLNLEKREVHEADAVVGCVLDGVRGVLRVAELVHVVPFLCPRAMV